MQEFSIMIPRGRGYGRTSSNRGRGRNNFQEIVQGNRKLIALSSTDSTSANSTDVKTFQEYLEWKKFKEEQENSPDSFKNVIMTELPFEENEKREIIFLLEQKDVQLNMENEEGPWFLMERYLSKDIFYPQETYKSRAAYEEILKKMQSVEFEHSMTGKMYAYSKFTVKKIISSEEWGLSPMKNYDIAHPNGSALQFNYWDYIQAFNKCLLYENDKKKHTWFIKVCYKVNNLRLPNWYLQWWQLYGPSEKILMEPFKTAFEEWKNNSRRLIALKEKYPQLGKIESMVFFNDFSIPWILKWDVDIGKTEQGIPCLQRKFFTKFWKKMADINPETQKIFGLETLDHIMRTIKEDQLRKAQEEEEQNKKEIPDLFKQFQKMKGKDLSPEEMIREYLQTMKTDLIKNIPQIPRSLSRPSSSSSSMHISDQEENQFSVLAGESQDPYEEEGSGSIPMNISQIFEVIQENILSEITKKPMQQERKQ